MSQENLPLEKDTTSGQFFDILNHTCLALKTEAQKICFQVLSEGISQAAKNKGNRMRETAYHFSSKFRIFLKGAIMIFIFFLKDFYAGLVVIKVQQQIFKNVGAMSFNCRTITILVYLTVACSQVIQINKPQYQGAMRPGGR